MGTGGRLELRDHVVSEAVGVGDDADAAPSRVQLHPEVGGHNGESGGCPRVGIA